jgi:hypothetical protein
LNAAVAAAIAACGIGALTSLSHAPTSRRPSTTALTPSAPSIAHATNAAPAAGVAGEERVPGLPAERAEGLARALHGQGSDRSESAVKDGKQDRRRVNEFLRRIRSGESPAGDTQNVAAGPDTNSQTQREFTDRLHDALRARLAESPAQPQLGGVR